MELISSPEALFYEGKTEHGSMKDQKVVLCPPSYFKTTVDNDGAETGERERAAAAAASPASTFVISPRDGARSVHHKDTVSAEEEMAALRLQNQALRCKNNLVRGSSTRVQHEYKQYVATAYVTTFYSAAV